MLSIEKRAVSGGFANVLLFLFTFIQSIVLVPVFLNHWGKEKYGVWLAISVFFLLIKTFDSGHQNYVGNELIKYYQTNINKAKEILASSLQVAYFIGAAELILGTVLLYFFSSFFWDIDQKQAIFSEAYYGTLALLVMWMMVGSVGGIWARVLIATGDFVRFTYWGLIFKVLETSILFYAALSSSSILSTCLLLAATTLIYTVIVIKDIRRKSPAFTSYKSFRNKKTGYQNFSRSVILTVSGMADQFGINVQVASVGSSLGKGTIPVLTTIRTITNVAVQVLTIFTAPVTVDIIRLYVQGDKQKIAEFFSIIWLITLLVIYLPFLALSPFVEAIYGVWTHHLLPFNKQLYYLLAFSICIISFGTPIKLLLTGINQLQYIITIAATRFLILCTIPFGIQQVGMAMVGIAAVFSELVASIIIPFVFFRSYLQILETSINKKVLLLSLTSLLLTGISFGLLSTKHFDDSVFLVTLSSFAVLLVLGVIHWNMLQIETRQRIFITIRSRLNIYKHKTHNS